MKQSRYRIRRLEKSGLYEVHRKCWFWWEHDGGDYSMNGRRYSLRWWYTTFEEAKLGVAMRLDRDRETTHIKKKDFYPPFPDKDDLT